MAALDEHIEELRSFVSCIQHITATVDALLCKMRNSFHDMHQLPAEIFVSSLTIITSRGYVPGGNLNQLFGPLVGTDIRLF